MTERFKAAVLREKSLKELGAVLQVIPNFNCAQVLAMAKKAEVSSKYDSMSAVTNTNGTNSALYTSGVTTKSNPSVTNAATQRQHKGNRKFEGLCNFCGVKGHQKHQCFKWKATQSGGANSANHSYSNISSNCGGGEKRKLLTCYKCNQVGHKADSLRPKTKQFIHGSNV